MATLGRRNQLTVLREAPPGFFLDGGRLGEILLPGRYIPAGSGPGSVLDVFVYRDSEDRLVATTETPLAMAGDFAFLRVVSVKPSLGAFLDWGLSKDLLLPRREQVSFPRAGEGIIVRVFVDEKSDRIVASERIDRWLDLAPPAYAAGQPVKLLIARETPLGYSAIVESSHWGLLYKSDFAARFGVGDVADGFVRAVRPDGKIDLSLDRSGYSRIKPLAGQILDALESGGGCLPLHDGSSPEEIRHAFGVSKKAFKQALGSLYRERQIEISPSGIRILRRRGSS
ncbi:MAG: S1-like domain-containing RNA-binding protein [Verrucomicrobiae bacterium]